MQHDKLQVLEQRLVNCGKSLQAIEGCSDFCGLLRHLGFDDPLDIAEIETSFALRGVQHSSAVTVSRPEIYTISDIESLPPPDALAFLASECCLALVGFPSILFKRRSNGNFAVRSACPEKFRRPLEKLVSHCDAIHRIKRQSFAMFADQSGSRILDAFAGAILQELRRYTTAVEQAAAAEPLVSLERFVDGLFSPMRHLDLLDKIVCEDARDATGDQLLTKLHALYNASNDVDSRGTIGRLLAETVYPLSRILEVFVTTGVLEDPTHEFFVSARGMSISLSSMVSEHTIRVAGSSYLAMLQRCPLFLLPAASATVHSGAYLSMLSSGQQGGASATTTNVRHGAAAALPPVVLYDSILSPLEESFFPAVQLHYERASMMLMQQLNCAQELHRHLCLLFRIVFNTHGDWDPAVLRRAEGLNFSKILEYGFPMDSPDQQTFRQFFSFVSVHGTLRMIYAPTPQFRLVVTPDVSQLLQDAFMWLHKLRTAVACLEELRVQFSKDEVVGSLVCSQCFVVHGAVSRICAFWHTNAVLGAIHSICELTGEFRGVNTTVEQCRMQVSTLVTSVVQFVFGTTGLTTAESSMCRFIEATKGFASRIAAIPLDTQHVRIVRVEQIEAEFRSWQKALAHSLASNPLLEPHVSLS